VVVEVHLFGSLSDLLGEKRRTNFECHIEAPVPLKDFLHPLGIPAGSVKLAMINHRAVSKNHLVHPWDRISLFPKEHVIFADWKNFMC
jgi:hypothetical protein